MNSKVQEIKCNLVKLQVFRLISLCNVSYKIITKVLANRHREILDLIISPTQSVFIQGRFICDNIILRHKCLNH